MNSSVAKGDFKFGSGAGSGSDGLRSNKMNNEQASAAVKSMILDDLSRLLELKYASGHGIRY